MVDVVLFDFFGTLVRYEPDRTVLGYPRSHWLMGRWGWEHGHDDFVTMWDEASRGLEERNAGSLRESSMVEYATAFAEHAQFGLTDEQCGELAAAFVREWSQHVRPIEGTGDLLGELARSYRLGIVSNTNDSEMVPRFVADHFQPRWFEHIVLSVDHGFRKPHESIYAVVLERFGVDASRAVFVGDSYEADYLGPVRSGMRALLIDPASGHRVPDADRLRSVLDVATHI